MTYPFPPDLAQEVTRRMATGSYLSEDDILRDAFAALKWRDEWQAQEVLAIQEGLDDMEAGRFRPLEQVDAEIRAKYGFPQDA